MPDFEILQSKLQTAEHALTQAKLDKNAAKVAYRTALKVPVKDEVQLMTLLTAFRQAQYMRQWHAAEVALCETVLRHATAVFLKSQAPDAAAQPEKPKRQGSR